MAANRKDGIADEVVDEFLKGRDPAMVLKTGGLVDELKKRLAACGDDRGRDHHRGAEFDQERDRNP